MPEIALPTTEQARTLTDRIKIAVEGTWQLIQEAYTSRTWAVLGYESWDTYCAAEFGQTRLRLPREERQEIVASLRESGLSTRAIASVTGLNQSTISRDLSSGDANASPGIQGTDGKTYAARRSTPIAEPTAGADLLGGDDWTPTGAAQTGPRPYSAPPTPERAPDRQPRTDVARTVLMALTELRQARESLQVLTSAHLARQDEETRSIWAARLNTELEALTDFHNTLTKENNQ